MSLQFTMKEALHFQILHVIPLNLMNQLAYQLKVLAVSSPLAGMRLMEIIKMDLIFIKMVNFIFIQLTLHMKTIMQKLV